MTKKKLTIWTIISNALIIIGAGHGIICLIFLEIAYFFRLLTGHNINDEYFTMSLTDSYDKSIGASTIFSFLGQILLIVSLFIKELNQSWVKLLGLFLLWIGFYYLTHSIFIGDSLSLFSFITGLPFLILSIRLSYKIRKDKLQNTG